ncbi:MAG: YihY/virulence factor BrkB family protein [Proteobacteria bacterium]|nr:YihY/virulence factor BrkB family protein [Pseudomonadota bacterium]
MTDSRARNQRHVGWIARRALDNWIEHEGARLAASLSFYTLLSLAPLVILTIAITAALFGRPAAQQSIIGEVGRLVGPEGARAVEAVVTYGHTPDGGGRASIIGLVILLFGASSVFGELQSALNKIWDVPGKGRVSLLSLVRSRLFSFAMVLAIGFVSLVSLTVSAGLTAFETYFSHAVSGPLWVLNLLNALVSFAGIAGLIAVVLKYVPDAPVRWRDVWFGAVTTAFLFSVGKSLIGLYLGKAAVGSAYGAAGSLVVVIVWVYYSAMIFYFGAEFTRARSSAAHPDPKTQERRATAP